MSRKKIENIILLENINVKRYKWYDTILKYHLKPNFEKNGRYFLKKFSLDYRYSGKVILRNPSVLVLPEKITFLPYLNRRYAEKKLNIPTYKTNNKELLLNLIKWEYFVNRNTPFNYMFTIINTETNSYEFYSTKISSVNGLRNFLV